MPNETEKHVHQKQHADENDDPAQHLFENGRDKRRGVDEVVEQPKAHANHKDIQQLVNNVAAAFAGDDDSRKDWFHGLKSGAE